MVHNNQIIKSFKRDVESEWDISYEAEMKKEYISILQSALLISLIEKQLLTREQYYQCLDKLKINHKGEGL